MSHRISIASRTYKFLGGRFIGTPDDLGIPNLAHIYEIPADRIRSEPLRDDDNAFLLKRIAGGSLTRQVTTRVGRLTTAVSVPLLLIGFMCLLLTIGAKHELAKLKVEREQAKANVAMCESMRANHATPLPTVCN
jgi:hypothetical protein